MTDNLKDQNTLEEEIENLQTNSTVDNLEMPCETVQSEENEQIITNNTKNTDEKICIGCGSKLTENQKFCSVCGQKVTDNELVNPIVTTTFVPEKKKVNKKLILCIGAIVVVAIIIIISIMVPSIDDIQITYDNEKVEDEFVITVKEGKSIKLGYVITPSEKSNKEVTWSSSDTTIATVNAYGEVSGIKGGSSCTITIKAGGKVDEIEVEVESGPNFQALYDSYCSSIWASVGSDGTYLSIDTNPFDEEDEGIAYYDAYLAIEEINGALGLPESLLNVMGETSAIDGRQTERYEDIGIEVTWKYHPDNGLELTYRTIE